MRASSLKQISCRVSASFLQRQACTFLWENTGWPGNEERTFFPFLWVFVFYALWTTDHPIIMLRSVLLPCQTWNLADSQEQPQWLSRAKLFDARKSGANYDEIILILGLPLMGTMRGVFCQFIPPQYKMVLNKNSIILHMLLCSLLKEKSTGQGNLHFPISSITLL